MANNNDNGDQGNGDDRAAIDTILVEIDFPATRDDLVSAAQDVDAADSVIVLLQSLPADEYTSREEVDSALDRTGSGQA